MIGQGREGDSVPTNITAPPRTAARVKVANKPDPLLPVITGVVGSVSLGAVPPLLGVFALFSGIHRGAPWRLLPRAAIAGSSLWLIAVVVSDLFNGQLVSITTITSAARPVLVLLSALLALRFAQRDQALSLLLAYLLSKAVFDLLTISPDQALLDSGSIAWWKYQLGWPVTLAVIATLEAVSRSRPGWKRFVIPIGLLAAVDLLAGARSLAGLTVCAVVAAEALYRWHSRGALSRFITVALCVVFAASAYAGYSSVAQSGALGTEQQAKWRQSERGVSAIFILARPEILVSSAVVTSHPLVGIGDRLQFSDSEKMTAIARLDHYGSPTEVANITYYFRPAGAYLHSKLPAVWAANGLVGAVGLALLIIVQLRRWVACRGTRHRFLIAALMFNLIWDVLFSPWTGGSTLTLGLVLGFVVAEQLRARDHVVTIPEAAAHDHVRRH